MTIYHKHHIIPKHMGGTDDPSNLIEVTIEEHALLHKQLWEELGKKEDFIAWQCLSGLLTMSEAKKLCLTLGPKKAGEKCRDNKIGFMRDNFNHHEAGKKTLLQKKGIHSENWDKSIGGRKGGQKCKENGIGFLSPTFDVGKASRGKIWINKDDVEIKIFPHELEKYKTSGWTRGRKKSFRRTK